MTHPKSHSCCLGFAIVPAALCWLMDAVPTGGFFILLNGFIWLCRVLHPQIPGTCFAPSNRVPGPGRRGPWQWSRPCAPPLPLLLPFCYFSDDHFSQGEGGEYEKAWNCISKFYYLGATEARGAGKKPGANDGFLRPGAELPSTRGNQRLPYPPGGGDRLVRM